MVEIRFIPPIYDREKMHKATGTSKFNTVGLYFAFESCLGDKAYEHLEKKIIVSSTLGIEKIYFDIEEQFGDEVDYSEHDEVFDQIDEAAIIEVYVVLIKLYPCNLYKEIVKILRNEVTEILQDYLTDKLPPSGNLYIDFIESRWEEYGTQ